MTSIRQLSFSGGEVSPALYARCDFNRYATGLRTGRNGFIGKAGGFSNRPGEKFVAETRYSVAAPGGSARLIPFIFSASDSNQNYCIELGDNYLRLIQNGSQVLETAVVITGITQANPAVVTTAGAHGYSNGQEVYISGLDQNNMYQLNGRNFKIAGVTANTFQLLYMDLLTNVNSTTFNPYSSAGTVARVYTVASPWDTVDIPYIKYAQNADVMTVVFGVDGTNNFEYEIKRLAHTNWTITSITYAPTTASVTVLSHAPLGGGAASDAWVVTALDAVTGEESLGVLVTNDSGAFPQTLTWSAVAGASKYYIYYRTVAGAVAYWIAETATNTYVHTAVGTPPQVVGRIPPQVNYGPTDSFTQVTTPVGSETVTVNNNHALAVGFFQQRSVYMKDETISFSYANKYKSFWIPFSNIPDSAPILFNLTASEVSQGRHIVDVGKLVAFVDSGVWIVSGFADGPIKPTSIDARRHTWNGSSQVRPIVIDNLPIYVQSGGSIVRDLFFDFELDGFRSNDLTNFAGHLLEGKTITDWAYQKLPNSTVWAVRSDGVLLSLTYIREQQLIAWTHHDTDGLYESVCVVPEGTEDAVYVVVKRVIPGLSPYGGTTRRYIERFTTRRSIVEPKVALTTAGVAIPTTTAVFLDSYLTYDGRNTNSAHTMTLSGGVTWDQNDTITITSSIPAYFFGGLNTDIGNGINIVGSDGTQIRLVINGIGGGGNSAAAVPNKTIPVSMRNVALPSWAKTVDSLTNLWHLEGESVAVIAEDFVIANPNNEGGLTVTNGTLTLTTPMAVVHVGMPFISDLETLDIDFAQSETRMDKKMLIGKVTAFLNNSRGGYCGKEAPAATASSAILNLQPFPTRPIPNMDPEDPPPRITRPIEITIKSEWGQGGRVCLRQVDPLPLEVLAIVPAGYVP